MRMWRRLNSEISLEMRALLPCTVLCFNEISDNFVKVAIRVPCELYSHQESAIFYEKLAPGSLITVLGFVCRFVKSLIIFEKAAIRIPHHCSVLGILLLL